MNALPNILFLLSDQHSYRCFSHLDPNGEGEPVHTPTLDGLAANATVLHQTYCQVAICTASRIGLLTGLSPMRSGGWTNRSYLKPGNQTLPEAFAAAGYTTCLVGKMHLGGNRQFVGFQHRPYGDLTGNTGHQVEPLAAIADERAFVRHGWIRNPGVTMVPESLLQEQVVVRETVAFLREHRHARPEKPWFLCASFSRPHWPVTAPRRHFERYWPHGVTPPKVGASGDAIDHPIVRRLVTRSQSDQLDPEAVLRTRAGYFACVDYLDEILGDLLSLLERDGLLENTIIVYLLRHGGPGHVGVAGRLRRMIDARWDFQLAEEQRTRDQAAAAANVLPAPQQPIAPGVNRNLYLMPDQRLVAADTPLYDPVTLTDKPQDIFADWPT